METIAFIIGVFLAIIGLGLSIAFHELGHLTFAKLFNVRVIQYMVGFGPTLFSKNKGETEYGIKLLPLGGYISMVGMYPPAKKRAIEEIEEIEEGEHGRERGGERGRKKKSSPFCAISRFFSKIIESGRGASFATFRQGEEDRAFYNLSVWKRFIIMFAGPFANVILAFIFFAIVISGFGIYTPQTSIAAVSACSGKWYTNAADRAAAIDHFKCSTLDPAAASGIMPGDVIKQINAKNVSSWNEVVQSIKDAKGKALQVTVDRGGKELHFRVLPRLSSAGGVDSSGADSRHVPNSARNRNLQRNRDSDLAERRDSQVQQRNSRNLQQQNNYFIGVVPSVTREQKPIVDVFPTLLHQVRAVIGVVFTMPQRIADMFASAFLGKARDPNGPMSVVGVGRLTGEVAQREEISIADRAATIFHILAAVNVALAVMNLIPLPPLDGGHIFAALWDGVRRRLWRLFGAKDPGPFDTAKLLPVSYMGAALLLLMGALFIFTDFVNPIKFFR